MFSDPVFPRVLGISFPGSLRRFEVDALVLIPPRCGLQRVPGWWWFALLGERVGFLRTPLMGNSWFE